MLPIQNFLQPLLSSYLSKVLKYFFFKFTFSDSFPVGDLISNTIAYHWRRQWHPTPVLLPGKSRGQRSLIGYSPRGQEESDMTEWLHFHFSLSCIGEGNGNPLQCSCLENPRDGGAWWAAVYGVAQSRSQLKWLSSSSSSLPLPEAEFLSLWHYISQVLYIAGFCRAKVLDIEDCRWSSTDPGSLQIVCKVCECVEMSSKGPTTPGVKNHCCSISTDT